MSRVRGTKGGEIRKQGKRLALGVGVGRVVQRGGEEE